MTRIASGGKASAVRELGARHSEVKHSEVKLFEVNSHAANSSEASSSPFRVRSIGDLGAMVIQLRSRLAPRRSRARWGRPLSLAALVPLSLASSAALAAPPAPSGSPPQQLPITARACLDPAGAAAPTCIQLEVPHSDRQYAMGLQRRGPLPPLRGMWFGYAPPAVARFWMHRTPEPLDMVFVSAGRVIAVVAPAAPCPHLPCRSYGPDQAVDGVLEIGAGQAAALGIGVGTAIRVESLSPGISPSGH